MNDSEFGFVDFSELEKLESEAKEVRRHIRMMVKVAIYTSFFLILGVTVRVILRGFSEGFF